MRFALTLAFICVNGFLYQISYSLAQPQPQFDRGQGFQTVPRRIAESDQNQDNNQNKNQGQQQALETVPEFDTAAPSQQAPSARDQPVFAPDSQPLSALNGSAETVTLRSIDGELEKVNALPDAEAPEIVEIKSLYQKAKLQITEANELNRALAQFKNTIRTAPAQLTQAQAELNSNSSAPKLPFSAETSVKQLPNLKDLKALKLEKEIQLQSISKRIDALAPTQQQTRATEIQREISSATQLRKETELQLKTPPTSENEFFVRARRTQLLAENEMLRLKIETLEAEAGSYEATSGLPAIQLELNRKWEVQLTKEIAIIDAAIHRRRQDEIDALNSMAIKTKRDVIQPLKKMAEDNIRLTVALRKLAKDIDDFAQQSATINAETARIVREQTTTESRIRVVGLSDSFGRMLQRNRNHLIAAEQQQKPINELNRDISDSQIAIFRWEDELELIRDIESSANEISQTLHRQGELGSNGPPTLDDALAAARDGATLLLQRRTAILGELKKLEYQRFQELVGMKTARVELENASAIYAELIDENILWVRNAPSMSVFDINDIVGASLRLAAPAKWHSVLKNLRDSFINNFPISILIVMCSGTLFLFRHRMLKELDRTGDRAVKRGCRTFGITVSAFVQTVMLAVTKLSPMLALGWLLARNTMGSDFSTSLGWALVGTFLIILPLELLNQSCRKKGLVHCHFDWTEKLRVLLRRNFGWMLPVIIPLLVVLLLLPMLGSETANGTPQFNASAMANLISGGQLDSGLSDPHPRNAVDALQGGFANSESWNRLGRVLLLVLLVITAIFSASIFHPQGALYADRELPIPQNTPKTKLRYFGYSVMIAVPLVLAAIAAVGYYYTSIRICESLLKTIALAIAVIILYSGAMRFLLVRRRNLRYEQLLHQRTQSRLTAEQKDLAAITGTASELIEIDLQNEPGLDITDVSRQARELTAVIFLLIAGGILLSIWQYVLPATKIMDDVQLWDVQLLGRVEFVTLRDVVFSSIMFLMTYFGVRNMPGMLELLLLQRLPLDAGARYAVTSIFRYILLVFGAILALGYLKIPWSNYSWLLAAISVGLGFGLQEIVANFVSGLILLLERPVRVGDVVTIDGTTGIVSRIQMRATTVTNWDNQELVVPNKDLITGKLLNWTLSSVVNRLSLKFGVAYGTDPAFVRQIVLDAISPIRALLKEPSPMVTFEEFGDSSLNFTLRCCVSTIERRWHIVHELNVAINTVLKEHNIEIPFPQRDLHIIDRPMPLETTDENANAQN